MLKGTPLRAKLMMRLHVAIGPAAEPDFELPPRLAWRPERRLSGRAVAIWESYCRDGQPPAESDFVINDLALECPGSSVGLSATPRGVKVSSVGAIAAVVFGLACGRLAQLDSALAGRLGPAFATLRKHRVPISFEASLSSHHRDGESGGTVLLTRAVMLPLLDGCGVLTRALVILTWKETLGVVAREQLYGEVGGALAANRAGALLKGSLQADAAHAVFA